MGKGKLILICQSGGEFTTSSDGSITYSGGEANAININCETLFDDLKLKLAEMCNLECQTVSIKYFLPGNRRNLITLKNDKDLRRMVDFHGNSVTADVFVTGKEGFDHEALNLNTSRDVAIKLAENVNHILLPSTIPSPINAVSPVVSRTVKHTRAGRTAARCGSSAPVIAVEATEQSLGQATSSSDPSSDYAADDDSDYAPTSVVDVVVTSAVPDSPTEFDLSCSPADTVKKRRRTASWKIGKNGPTIVSVPDDAARRRSQQKRTRSNRHTVAAGDMEQLTDVPLNIDFDNPSTYAITDEDSLENLVASWKDGITGIGQEFKSVKEFRDVLQKYAIAHRFVYKLKKNDTNRASGRCVAEGCSWRIHASWVQASQSFQIKKFNSTHSCGGESWKSAHPAKNWLVSIIKERLRDSPHQKPREIAKNIFHDFGIELKYTQARRGIEDARQQLQGSYKEAYSQLPQFCEKLLETNPGSYAKLITSEDKRFQRLFISFHASIHGFRDGCRPLLFLEATSLKSKNQEILLTATALDGDDACFPVAYAVVDVENDGSWSWFLEELKSSLSTSQSITFVSDREKELKTLVVELFENSYHGFSIYHLLESFQRNLKGPFLGDGRATLPGSFLAAAHAVRPLAFKRFTEQIKQVSSHAYDWIMQIEQENWTSLLFKGERYNHIMHDIAEPYRQLMEDVRESTLLGKLEALGSMISKWINDRRVNSSGWSANLTPSKEDKMHEEAVKARGLKVLFSSDTIIEVQDDCNHVVNIEGNDCTCLMWKVTGLPCRHAIAVFSYMGRSPYDYCSKYFTADSYRSTYSKSINAVPDISKPVDKEEVDSEPVLPPSPTRLQNMPKKEQPKILDPNKRTVCCSRCKELGHNKASCKAVL